VGTAKRERQKANRQLRLQEMAREARVAKTKRLGLRYGIGIPVAIALLWGLVLLVSRGDSNKAAAPTTVPVTTIAPVSTLDPPSTPAPSGPTTVPVTVPGSTITGDTPCPAADGSSARVTTFAKAPPMCIDVTKTYEAEIATNKGVIVATLDPVNAPLTVNNFVVLARYHFFDNTECHRIIPNFVAQCGDPTATGSGGPGYTFVDELPKQGAYKIGSLAMANSGPNTNGSQFFVITGSDGASLPPSYSLFGQMTAGDTTISALDAAGNPNNNGVPPLQQVIIESVTIVES
jgi:cyclophilin family peptidyl-prolyl cis-trans isomerase